MDKEIVISTLIEQRLVSSRNVHFRPLRGGVSSDIFLLTEGGNRFVVKQAREKLKVDDDWTADTSRNLTEQNFIKYVCGFRPDSVAKVLCRSTRYRFFVMEYLDSRFENWKTQMLQGIFSRESVCKAAGLLATIHRHSFMDSKAERIFDTTADFKSLRIDPYLLTVGQRHPKLKHLFQNEAARLGTCRETLVHGDYSPKNIMISPERIVLLDHEVAWYGDPAFDVAFLLTHLYLKMLMQHLKKVSFRPVSPRSIHTDRSETSSGISSRDHFRIPAGSANSGYFPEEQPLSEFRDLTVPAWETYFNILGEERKNDMEMRVGRLLLMLLLARVDGKSPAGYLDSLQYPDRVKEMIRNFVYDLLSRQVFRQSDINRHWKSKLKNPFIEN